MKRETYTEMKNRHHKEFNTFPLGAAFSNKQFDEMMQKWGLQPTDTDKIISIGAGCFIRKSDKDLFKSETERFEREMETAKQKDRTGGGFIYEMFKYELANHEFGYTGDLDDTLDALDLTYDQVVNDEKLKHGLNKALLHYGGWQI